MAVARGGEEGVLEPLAAQQTQQFLAEAMATDAIEREVDGRVDDDAQFCHGECLVDDSLVKLRHTKYNDIVKLRRNNHFVGLHRTTLLHHI